MPRLRHPQQQRFPNVIAGYNKSCLKPYHPHYMNNGDHSQQSRNCRQEDDDDHSMKSSRNNKKRKHETKDPSIVIEKSFWGTTSYSRFQDVMSPPCDPAMDPNDGPLPQGSYYTIPSMDPTMAKTTKTSTTAMQSNSDTSTSDTTHEFSSSIRPFDRNKLCQLAVAIDVQRPFVVEPSIAIQRMQHLIDTGFTTFQLAAVSSLPSLYKNNERKKQQKGQNNYQEQSGKQNKLHSNRMAWGVEQLYGRLIQETPRHIIRDHCHLVVPMHAFHPEAMTKSSIRETVVETLSRMGVDSLDTLQLHYDNVSPYHLDLLDTLTELHREGYIESVALAQSGGSSNEGTLFGQSLLPKAQKCGFSIGAIQQDCNLWLPHKEYPSSGNKYQDASSSIARWYSSPLAGGFLTNRYLNEPWTSLLERTSSTSFPCTTWTRPERHYWQLLLNLKGRKHGSDDQSASSTSVWDWYQEQILESTLHFIAQKHDVSIAAVALRWVLQQQQQQQQQLQQQSSQSGNTKEQPNRHPTSAVVNCGLLQHSEEEDLIGNTINSSRQRDRSMHLRQVFRFELDSDDFEQLQKTFAMKDMSASSKSTTVRLEESISLEAWEELEEEYQQVLLAEMQEQQKQEEEEANQESAYPAIDLDNQKLWL